MADPFSAWGAEASPDRLIMLDQLKALDVGSAAQQRLADAAMAPDKARLYRAQAGKLEQDAEEERKVAELMRRVMEPDAQVASPQMAFGDEPDFFPQGQPQARGRRSITDTFDRAAELFAGAGMIKKAQDAAKTVADIRAKQDEGSKDRAQAVLNQLKSSAQQADNLAQFFGGATDQRSLDLANRLYEFQTGERSPLSGAQYDPAVIESINQQAMSAKDRYELARREARDRQRQSYENSRLEDFRLNRGIRERELRLRQEVEARRAKNSGGTGRAPSAEPKPQEVAQVKNLIKRDFPFMAGDTAADRVSAMNDAAFTIASEARALMRRNPALSGSAAINQAYASAVRNGDIEAEEGTMRIGRKFRFAGGGRSPETALMVPKTQEGLKVGRYYVNDAGQIGKWNGKGFTAVQVESNRAPLSGDNRNRDEED